MNSINCPVCHSFDIEGLDIARENTRHYGTRNYILRCSECKNKLRVTMSRVVVCSNITQADENAELDFMNTGE